MAGKKPGPAPAGHEARSRRTLVMLMPSTHRAMDAASKRSGETWSAWIDQAILERLEREELSA